ncbi:MAG TPA: SRPBCC family protein, partial [Casimicrobiaceae bacterium]|nr:SRPBCC family protein [Casimicrobiaceae bacterium]
MDTTRAALLQCGFFVALGVCCAWVWAQTPGRDISVHVEKDGSAFVVTAALTVAANADEVWAVLTDYDHMAQILSNVDASEITNRDGNTIEVTQKSHANIGALRISQDSVRQVELSPKHEIRSRNSWYCRRVWDSTASGVMAAAENPPATNLPCTVTLMTPSSSAIRVV